MPPLTTIYKFPVGYEDLLWDIEGTGRTSAVRTSSNRTRSVRHLNANHIPTITTTRAKTRIGSGTPVSSAKTITAAIEELYDDLAKIGEPDDSTLEISSGILQVKDDGITAAKLRDDASTDANRAVTTDHVRDSAITAVKLNTDAVTTIKMLDACVTTAKINDLAVTEDKLAASAVTNDKVSDKTIRPGKLNLDNGSNAESVPAGYIVRMGTDAVGTGPATHDVTFSALGGTLGDYRAFVSVEDSSLATASNNGQQALQSIELTDLSTIQLTFDGSVTTGGNVYFMVIKPTT